MGLVNQGSTMPLPQLTKCFTESTEHGEAVKNDFQILVDSDAFVGRFYGDDPHHKKALSTFAELEERGELLVTTSLVVAETATVLSHRSGQVLARRFLDVLRRSKLSVIHIDERLQHEATEVFVAQNARGSSFTDCANVAVMRRFHIPTVFSFDKAYGKQFGVKLMA